MKLTLKSYDPPPRKRRRSKRGLESWQDELLKLIHAGKRTKSRSGKPLKYWER